MLTQETAYHSVCTTKLFTNQRRDFREYCLHWLSDSIVFFPTYIAPFNIKMIKSALHEFRNIYKNTVTMMNYKKYLWNLILKIHNWPPPRKITRCKLN